MPKTTKEIKDTKPTDEKEKKSKKSTTVKSKSTVTKKGEIKSTTSKAKTTAKKKTSASKKTSSTKKTTTTTKKKTTTTQKKVAKKESPISILEYYDLPYRYNQTVVKVLAQTPTTLFVYWDISDDDREKYKSQYGDNFFETTKPVLVIHNETMNYTYEIEINDFANSWYLHINDADCKYFIELGRRSKIENSPSYIQITYSNKIDAPNNHVLFNNINSNGTVTYKNVKTKSIFNKNVATFLPNMSKIYNANDLYKKLYPNEWQSIEKANINNPSSGGISSFR